MKPANADYRLKDYDISDFDENMNLKFGIINSLVIIYLISPFAISFVCSHADGNAGLLILKSTYLIKELMYISLIGTLPILFFLIAFLIRKEVGVVEKIKRHGKVLIRVTAFINFILWSYILFHAGYKSNLFHILSLVASLFVVVYTLKSKRLSDYFETRRAPPEK